MLRILLTVLLPIAIPFALYAIYLFFARRSARAAGHPARPGGWQDAPWGWIATASALLLVSTLLAVRSMSGVEPGTKVESPRLIGLRLLDRDANVLLANYITKLAHLDSVCNRL